MAISFPIFDGKLASLPTCPPYSCPCREQPGAYGCNGQTQGEFEMTRAQNPLEPELAPPGEGKKLEISNLQITPLKFRPFRRKNRGR
jgi:hypothetical protein